MGIIYPDAKRLWSARRRGVSFKDTATLARHSLFLHPGEVRWFQAAYAASHPGAARPLASYHFGDWADELLHTFLGVETLTSIDHSAYEGAGVVHDLNTPVPPELVGRFDAVIDAGTLEHVFNFPVAVSNAMRMLRVGGTLFMTTPANNLCGHGFYQFSPELMFRVFTPANGFAPPRVTLSRARYAGVELSPIRETYQVTDPASLRRRVMLMSTHPVLMMVEAVKEADVALFREPPQQSDYVLNWEGERPPPGSRGLARRVYDRLPQTLRHHVQGILQSRRFSFANRSAYARIN